MNNEFDTQQKPKRKMSNLLGVLAFLGKIASKIAGLKILWAAVSFASYAYLFTWQFALLIIGSVFFHELGHVWAAKRCGMQVKGIYLIPFVGGAALINSQFKSRKEEVFVAIMGPIWGFALALAMGGIYLVTKLPLFAGAASWIALINLFNLLPINPLDGGRILKSIAFSIHHVLGYAVLILGLALALVLAIFAHIWLLVIMIIVGAIELAVELSNRDRLPRMGFALTLASGLAFLVLAIALYAVMVSMGSEPGAQLALKIIEDK